MTVRIVIIVRFRRCNGGIAAIISGDKGTNIKVGKIYLTNLSLRLLCRMYAGSQCLRFHMPAKYLVQLN